MSSKIFHTALSRAIPLSLLFGAVIEAFMIKVEVGRETFYDTYVRLESEKHAAREAEQAAGK